MNDVTKMAPKISIVTLGVNNLLASTKFYSNGLGLPYSSHSNKNISFFELNGTWLALFPQTLLAEDAKVSPRSNGFSGITLAHNVKDKQDVDSVLIQAQKAGAKITKSAEDTVWGGYSGYFSDLDGYLWEVAWNPHFWVE